MIYQTIRGEIQKGRKLLAVLIDPDQYTTGRLDTVIAYAREANVDFFLVGGSLVSDFIEGTVAYLKEHCDIPVVLFPGSLIQISDKADALLLLSLISGRNPEYLIGNHVFVAPLLKKSSLEVLATGYILTGNDPSTSVAYISNTCPIPPAKTDIIVATALAGQMLGQQMIYLEAGSGSVEPVSTDNIKMVRTNIDIPLIVGGGVRSKEQAASIYQAGADVLVTGSAVEERPSVISSFAEARDNAVQ